MRISRREMLGATAAAAAAPLQAARPKGYLVENTTHMFSEDQARFPYSPKGTYKPPPHPIEAYIKFATEAKIDHTVIIQSEVYQDDHRYLESACPASPSGLLRSRLAPLGSVAARPAPPAKLSRPSGSQVR